MDVMLMCTDISYLCH